MGESPINPGEEKAKSTEAALHWMIALEDRPDDPEVATAFETWLASSEDHVRAWAEARHVWNVLGEAHEAREMAGRRGHLRRSSQSMAKTPVARGTRRRGYFTASMLAVATICVAAVFQQDIRIWLQADYSTGVAQTRALRLEDGSTAYLGADSAIEVSFDQASRNVRLLTGEVYFEVEPDADRPFRVDAGDVDTTVLGTAFDVRMMAEGTAIAVNRGRVAVAASTAEDVGAPLEAGDWVHVSHAGKVERGRDLPDLAGGWRSGMFVVKDRSVGEAVDAISRYYRGKIVLADAAISNQRITGVYNLNEPIGALTAVAAAHGAQVRQISPWLAVVSSW